MKSILKDKSYEFALKVVEMQRFLVEKKKEYVLSKQVLRSGTAIGALVREAEFGQSRADFISKMSIALKEANETEYWLAILKDTDYISNELYEELNQKIKELIKMLISSVKTAKEKIQ